MPVRCLLLSIILIMLEPLELYGPGNPRSELSIAGVAEYLEQKLEDTLNVRDPIRAGGFMYAIDIANIMRVSATVGNRRVFDRAFHLFLTHFLVEQTNDSNARSTVLWRMKEGDRQDASGSAETIAVADGLWQGYERWGEERFKHLAIELAKAYVRHGYWIDERRYSIKNYYNYQTRSFAENTWLLNHAPDVLLEIGKGTADSLLVRHAYGIAAFMKDAYVQEGFSKEMFDAGIRTIFKKSTGYYAPDGIYSLFSSLLVARALLPFDTTAAAAIVRFGASNVPQLWSKYYYNPLSQQFRAIDSTRCTLTELAVLLALAAKIEPADTSIQQAEYTLLHQGILPLLSKEGWNRFNQFYFQVPFLIEALRTVVEHSENLNSPSMERF